MKIVTKIVITGVESTGKTTLARKLAHHFNEPWVPEYARQYLPGLNRPYQEDDLLKIAQGQIRSEIVAIESAKNMIICDTDTTVIKIWSLVKYGRCHPSIENYHRQNRGQLYLLPDSDVPHESDPLRENPDDRDHLFEMYLDELQKMGVNYLILRGIPPGSI